MPRIALLPVLCTLLMSGCSTTPIQTPTASYRQPRHILPVSPQIAALLGYARSLEGSPYRWGGTSPVSGFDCSGYVQHVYSRYGIRLPRRSKEIAAALRSIPGQQRQAGDLVFFHTYQHYSHVGIYLGDNKFIHAASSQHPWVMISDLDNIYWSRHLAGFRRAYSQGVAFRR